MEYFKGDNLQSNVYLFQDKMREYSQSHIFTLVKKLYLYNPHSQYYLFR